MGIRRVWWAALRRWWALALCGCALAALSVRVPTELSYAQHFPAHTPAALAHSLADFSIQPHIGSWSVEEDRSNYTTWRYSVSFKCGARCVGRAHVDAHDEPRAAPQHGHGAREHRVAVTRVSCTSLPLIAWPQFCEELETSSVVSGVVGGAQLREVSRTRCSVLATISGACARWLRAQLDLRTMRLRGLHIAPLQA